MATSPQWQAAVSARDELLRTAQAKRGLLIFLAVVIPLSVLFETLIATTRHMLWIYYSRRWAAPDASTGPTTLP